MSTNSVIITTFETCYEVVLETVEKDLGNLESILLPRLVFKQAFDMNGFKEVLKVLHSVDLDEQPECPECVYFQKDIPIQILTELTNYDLVDGCETIEFNGQELIQARLVNADEHLAQD